MRIKLPSLSQYKQKFIEDSVKLPLPEMRYRKEGLLKYLPKVSEDKKGWPWTEETNPYFFKEREHWPKITIVTPSFNQGEFIEQTIRAVLLQNYPNLEYIIIDGGSSDNSVEIIKKYSPWISYWHSCKDHGQSHAINLGFSLASGNYFAWVNSDDYYLPATFFNVINRFYFKKAEFVYGYAYVCNVDNQSSTLIKIPPFLDYFKRIPTLLQPSCFWCADIHQPLWEELHCSLDYELWIRMLKGCKKSLLKIPLSVANSHPNAKSIDPDMKASWENDHRLICSPDAYGPVYNWKQLNLLYNLYSFLFK